MMEEGRIRWQMSYGEREVLRRKSEERGRNRQGGGECMQRNGQDIVGGGGVFRKVFRVE